MQIGHLHPLLVHLPIGILSLTFLLEIFFRRKKSDASEQIIKFSLLIGVLSALVSLGTGWFLGDNGGYDVTLLFNHRWLAVALTACTLILYIFKLKNLKKLYMPLFVIVMILLGITGHYGGSMTHGEDYLFQEAKPEYVGVENVETAQVFTEIIQPILNNKCISCHNQNKLKGGLLLTGKSGLLAGGDSGNLLDSLSGKISLFLQRLHLPLTEKEHMPPKGKVQLTEEELALIEWWMTNENCFDCTAETLDQSPKMAKILKGLEVDNSARGKLARQLEAIPEARLNEIRSKAISVNRIDINSPLLVVNLSGKNLQKSDFSALKTYAEHIVEMNLDYSNFNDDLASQLSDFKNLTKLQLKNTDISDKAISKISKLEKLESLNVFGTSITDASLKEFKSLKNLENLYTQQTQISDKALVLFSEQQASTKTKHISDKAFSNSQLGMPIITSKGDVFKDFMQVELSNVFDVDLFYTLDGSEPDSTSIKYEKPIVLEASSVLKTFSFKKGWTQSKTLTKDLRKAGITIDSIWYGKPPSPYYLGSGWTTLTDFKQGDRSVTDPNWIGFMNEPAILYFELKTLQKVSQIAISTISSPMDFAFLPTAATVWVSKNGRNYKKIKYQDYGKAEPNLENRPMYRDVDFLPTEAKYIKLKLHYTLKNPEWHPYPSKNSKMLIDEIVIN
ncbi:chitobiase/beta-hexosaminidase C-terminal domain-containing protein [Flavobacteriaceae bacterium]|nr:chitobiase/beta-hexosaminidase C-terminal domain-containing protein [Flavobacteriaceae bacterium]